MSSLTKFFSTFKLLITSFFEVIVDSIKSIKLRHKQKKIKKLIERITKTKINVLRDNYILVGLRHLEILPHSGIFIQNTHRLYDEYPRIVAVDDNLELLEDLETSLDGSFALVEPVVLNLSKEPLQLNTKFHSIAANFAIDRISGGLIGIENFIKSIHAHCLGGGVFFGSTMAGKEIPIDTDSYKYLKAQNELGIWFNINTSKSDIEEILNRYFIDVVVETEGYCLVFRGNVKRERIDDKFRLTIEKAEGKYLELS